LVVPVATRDDVIDALEQVAEQGEAPHAEEEQSHFRRFLRIYREYLAHFPEGSAVRPCRDVPVNPTTFKRLRRENGDASARSTLISHPASAKWAALFDMRYRLLLTGLAHTFRLARTSAPQRGPGTYQAVLHRAFGEMYNLKALADILVRQPLSEDPAEPFKPAGPTFQMPYTLDLPENAPSTWQQYRDILSACAEVRAWLRDPAHARLSAQETEYLATQANADQGFEAWLETVQDAARVAGSMMQ
ncbi:MAG: ferritin-like protein, partial [Gammaproteobacteria bacterium]|nr:ferritin-like protein [Gammaproteobacteria bacterium]